MRRRVQTFRPFTTSGRRTVAAILLTFAFFSAVSVGLSVWSTSRSQYKASVLEVAARQRTLAERYVKSVLLARVHVQANPNYVAGLLEESTNALLDGGMAPAVNGDDDETRLAAASGKTIRAQLVEERKLVHDLAATGAAILGNKPGTEVPLTAHEHLIVKDPMDRLRVLGALTSNVALNAARSIATANDRNINNLITLQMVLGIAGFIASLLLGWALIAATRRQTAHFRSLVTSSTDLVLVFGEGGCRYASESMATVVGRADRELFGEGFADHVHPDDLAAVHAAWAHGEPAETVFRVRNRFGEWRHLEAHVTDLRANRRIRGVVLNARDITERVRLEEQLTRQAFYDGLTELPNRALFRDRLQQALARSGRSGSPLAVLLVDLDGFKQVNDSLGHDAGDQLLEAVAERFTETSRPSDTLARLGGDEFALLLDGAHETHAVGVARRLLVALEEPIWIAGRELVVGASIGIALHAGGAGEGEELVRHADVAMYAAKEAGRGRFEVFRYDMARELGELLGLEHELRLGLQRGEFVLHYQPEVDLENGAIVGVEALLRWNSPRRGVVPPDRFISVAEATGLILPLGAFVLREACLQTARWRAEGVLPEKFVTWVNLSGRQLAGAGIGAVVRGALEEADLPPTYLGLEVTETALVHEGGGWERSQAELQALHEDGVRIAIDDFGTGFSSLGQLRHFPVDMIKVDRSFIQGMEEETKDAAIAANLVTLAHALGVLAIAEGIESNGQLTSLRDLGCDLAQGFLFARPMPAGQVQSVLAGGFGDLIEPGSAVA
ncbi:MAG TPA: EAL domain-containing protein [Gaiellaceae bacterium]|jgi:diguanylate cyclase (GGDEF)-like protein/PAS domain S-box-containing protein|nr:EAL domain-containing protein [Gaiellaceae bacterium]